MNQAPTTPAVSIEIDGVSLCVPQGTMIIEAADAAGIVIPRFCYHKKLSIAANCRMCLVDAEKSKKPLPACATPVTEGMKIYTKSPKAIQYQKSVLEFLLINHPLDCPICDQGGECELQDLSMGHGADVSRFHEKKRVIEDKDIGPLIATDLTRCIHCTRCVRFGLEIAGEREMGMLGRGEHSEIATFLSKPLESELSGNIIDLCPVGALTSKPFRFRARPWELQQKPTIAAHDCIGSNIFAHVRGAQVMRVAPRENEALNEMWLSDRDRFSYEGLYGPKRLQHPMIKEDGQWKEASWDEALSFVSTEIKSILLSHNGTKIGGLISPSATVEELYLFQKMLRALGSDNIDHRLRQLDFDDSYLKTPFPGISLSLPDIEEADLVVLIGSNVRKEQPLIHHRIRQASLKEASVWAINPQSFDFRFEKLTQVLVNPDDMLHEIAEVLSAVLALKPELSQKCPDVLPLLKTVCPSAKATELATALLAAKKPVLFTGALAHHHPWASLMLSLVATLRLVLCAQGGQLTDGANSTGAYLAGALPHHSTRGNPEKPGLTAGKMLTQPDLLKCLFLFNVEPELDSAYGQAALDTLSSIPCVIATSLFLSPNLEAYAKVILPLASFFESSGTWVNACGSWQSTSGVTKPVGQARPGWKIIRALANFLALAEPEFSDETSPEVLERFKQTLSTASFETTPFHWPEHLPPKQSVLKRIVETPMYAIDPLLRQSRPLQMTPEMTERACAHIAPSLAQKLGVSDGDFVLIRGISTQNTASPLTQGLTLPIVVDPTIAPKAVSISNMLTELSKLGSAFNSIEVVKQ